MKIPHNNAFNQRQIKPTSIFALLIAALVKVIVMQQ